MAHVRKPSIDLGLAVSGALLEPGDCRTHREIARYCDCTWQLIDQIEKRAIRKIRLRLGSGNCRHLTPDLIAEILAL